MEKAKIKTDRQEQLALRAEHALINGSDSRLDSAPPADLSSDEDTSFHANGQMLTVGAPKTSQVSICVDDPSIYGLPARNTRSQPKTEEVSKEKVFD